MVLQSMTGYGRGEAAVDGKMIVVELTSLNHKNREIRLGLVPELQCLEPFLSQSIGSRINRGAVNLQVRLLTVGNEPAAPNVKIKRELILELTTQLHRIADEIGLDRTLTIGDLLAIPGIVELPPQELPMTKIKNCADKALRTALDELLREREREGKIMAGEIRNSTLKLIDFTDQIDRMRDSAVRQYKQRLRKRIALLQIELSIDDERLAKEVAFTAQRTDITEELVRLRSHLQKMLEIMDQDGQQPIGRKLQFLCQEIQREVNTLAAKTGESDITGIALEFKSELEKIREQCSNIE